MKVLILQGSPRLNGNTEELLKPLIEELEAVGHETEQIGLYGLDIKGCIACRTCQKDWTKFGCVLHDDGQMIFERVMEADLLIFATPIYSFYCTAPMKALLDRLVYVMNKFYGEEKGPSLWEGKKMALVMTCGYSPDKGTDLFVAGMERYAKHSHMKYLGSHAARHLGYKTVFMDEEKEQGARNFAKELIEKMKGI